MTGTLGSPASTREATDESAGASLEDRLADRTRELDELTQQHAATAEILDIIARSTSGLQPVLDAVVRAAVRHCGADDATLFLREGTEVFGAAHEGPLPSGFGNRRPIGGSPLDALIIRDGQTIHAPDTEALDPVEFAPVIAVARQRGVRALVGAPIRHAGEGIGFLLLRRREVGPFSARQIATLETFATQAGIAVANAGVITELRESLDRQTATSDILRIISSSPTDIRPVFDAVAVAARRLCGAPSVGIFLRDGTELVVMAFDGSPSAGPYGRRQPLDRTSVTGRAIVDGVTVHTPDILALDPAEFGVGQEFARRHGNRATLAAPLLREGRAVGGILLAKLDPVAFTPRQIELLESFAAQAVIALENTRLFTELRESLDQQTATAEVLQVINASPGDTTPVFEAILQKAHALCAIAYGSLQLYDGQKFRAVATHNLPEALATRLREGYVPGPNTRQLVDGAAFAQSADIGIVDEPMAKAAAEGGLRTLLRVALRKDGRLLGQIVCARTEVRPFADREIAPLQGFAAQAVIAMENTRLMTETREALERQTAMAEVLAAINANPGDLTPVFATILDKALSLSGSRFGNLARFDGEKFWQVAGRNIPPALASHGLGGAVPEAGTLLHRLLQGDDVAHLADIRDDEAYRAGVPSRVLMADEAGVRSLLIVALRKDGRLLGCIHIYRTEVRAFSEAEVALVRSFADQAVIAMENARLITETREALEQQTATAEILRVISQSPTDVRPVLTAIAKAALRFCGAPDAFVSLRDGDDWVPLAHEGALTAVTPQRRKLSRGSAVGRCILDGRSIEVIDMAGVNGAEFPESVEVARSGGWRAALIAPMLRDGVAIGAISLRRPEPGAFTPRQLQLLEAFAAQAVIAIENVRLFTELDARNADLRESLEQQTATAEILRVISQSPTDVQPVLNAVVKAAVRFCGASDTIITLRDGDDLIAAAHEGPLSFSGVGDRRPLDRSSSSGRAIIDGKTIHIPDVTILDPGEFGQLIALAQSHGFGAAISAPMLREGAAIGSVLLRKVDAGPFTQQQIALLETFAAQAVIAIENVRLFTELDARNTELRESLEQQTATADILRVISQSPTDVGPVLQAVVRAAVRLCGAEDSVVALRDGDESVTAAHEGPLGAVIGFRARLDPRGRGTVRAIVERRTIHVPDLMAPDHDEFAISRALGSEQNFRAFVVTPMMREGVAVGSIGLRRRNPGPFTPRQIALLESFAAQAVIAIENVRLFNETKEALERQTATAEILSVISRSPTDVQPVFDVIAQSAMRLLNGWSVLIFRYDGERMRVIASHGGLPGTDAASVRAALGEPRPEDMPYPGDAILNRAVTQIIDAEAADVPEGLREVARARGWRANIAVPMLHDGPPIGVITVSRKEPGAFTEREIGLLRTFAAQALIAIENVRLFTELGARNEDLRESLEQQTATAEVLATINANPGELGPVFDAMLQKAMLLCGATVGELRTYDGQDFRQVASRGMPDAYDDHYRPRSVGYGPGTGPARILAGEPLVHIPDLIDTDAYRRRDPDRVALVELGGARASLIAPLLRGSEVTGMIMLLREQPGPFGDRQIALLQNFAAQAVIAIENARLVSEQREALERQTATAEVLQVINANPGDLKPVFETMLEKACKLCDADSGAFWNVRDGLVHAPVTRGFGSALVDFLSTPRRVDPETGMGRLMQGHSVAHIVDLAEGPAYRAGDRLHRLAVDEDGIRSLVAVPLRKDGVILGAFGLTRHKVQAFTDKHIALVENFAAQAVIAMENARLIDEIRTARDAAETSLGDLKIAQANLIQAEKMASLGQLTAGIAHEIKNPLNFVNNFATLSIDLLDELKEIAQPAIERLDENRRAELDETMDLLTGNLGKIAEHGKRADGIVKSMLSHSRSGKGDRTPSDINALVEEALNLAYHGARAQDKEFNISLERDYGPPGEPIDVVPQDIARVFLNLFGNGFYAANKRRLAAREVGFRPTLRVSTRDLGDAVEVKVRDNGIGIPPEARDKLFQPFFTTKPTGEGTGLGLSISYDIVTQQHAGSIEVESEPNSFTEFTIRLPRRRRAASPGERP